jgi:hypothetical protein
MKNTLKKFLCLCLGIALAGIGFNSSNASAQIAVTTPTITPSVEQAADAFAVAHMAYGRGNFYFTGVTNGISRNISADFTLQMVRNRWGFTQMSINGTNLPIDPAHPMWEIPPYLAGSVKDFQFNVQGYDANGQPVRYGYSYLPTLAPGDDISVVIYLNYKRTVVQFPLSGGHNASNTGIVSDDGNYNGYYDPQTGAFVVYYDPLNPPKSWLIIDERSNSIIGSVPFGGGSGGSPVASGNGFALNNQDDIPELYASNDNWSDSRSGLAINHTIVRNGTNLMGKVIIAHVSLATDYFSAFVNGLATSSVVQVYGVSADGTSHHIADWAQMPGQYQVVIPNVTGYTDYKIVVIGLSADPIGGFGVSVYDTTYPIYFGDGGGKGLTQ